MWSFFKSLLTGRMALRISFPVTVFLTLYLGVNAFGQGNAVVLDGVDDHVTVPHSSLLNLGDQFTLEAWVYINDNATTNEAIVHKWQTNQYTLEMNGNKFNFVVRTSDNFYVLASPNNLPRDRWVHIAGVRDGGTMYIYEDGVQTNSRSIVGTTNTAAGGPLFFGRRSDYVGDIMLGKIGEARIWNVARSSTEIANNYTSTLVGNETGLVGLWNFEETSGITTFDATSNALNGTLINGPAFVATAYSNGTTTETYFTSGTFTVPTGISTLTVEAWGGGGGGGGKNSLNFGGGGGGGAFSKSDLSVSSLVSYAVNIGNGGIGGGGGDGNDGGDSWFNNIGVLLAKGGSKGIVNQTGGIGGQAGSGIGSIKFSGANGTNGDVVHSVANGWGSTDYILDHGGDGGSSAGIAASGTGRVAPSGGGDGGIQYSFGNYNYIPILCVGTVCLAKGPGGGGGGGSNSANNTGAAGKVIISYSQPTAAINYDDADGNVNIGQSLLITATLSEAIADTPVLKIGLSGGNVLGPTDMVKVSPTVYTYLHTVGAGPAGMTEVNLSTGKSLIGNVIIPTPTSGKTFTIQSEEPTSQATNLIINDIWSEGMKVAYTNGNGTSRILVVKEGSEVNAIPVDFTTYNADPVFGNGSDLGSGNFVVGSGVGPISVTGLAVGTNYHFRIFEYNGINGGENYNISTASGNPGSASTLSLASQTTALTFNSSGTFNVPAGINYVTAEAWGGGGAGGGSTSTSFAANGGGGGGYSKSAINVTPLSMHTISVGLGGQGLVGGNGQSGGDSWFGSISTLLAKGGSGGVSAGCVCNAQGGLAMESIGTLRYSGGTGGSRGNSLATGGGGGSSAGFFADGNPGDNGAMSGLALGGIAPAGGGSGGRGQYYLDGQPGLNPGGGGGGGGRQNEAVNTKGGSGADGKVIVSYTQPTVGITYDDADANVIEGQSLIITATFSELIADAPIMKISLSGGNILAATNMTKASPNVYIYAHTVSAGTGITTVNLSVGESTSGNLVVSAPISGATFTILSNEPTTQASALSFTASTTSCAVNYTNGNGTSRLLVAKAGSAVDADPLDGTAYTPNTVFGSGPELGTGNYVLGAGSGAISITGLTPGVTYHFRAYEFNGTGTITNYNTSIATGNPGSKTTLSLSSFTPTNAGEGAVVTITGTDFTGATAVSFGGTAAASFNVVSPTSITAVVDGGASGVASVTTPGGSVTKTGFIFIPKPVAATATAIAQTSFDANWSASTGASGYYLDVSTSDVFAAYVTGYQNLSVGNVTSYTVNTNLTSGTTYYYRVRASADVPLTSSSNAISLVTIPPNPVSTAATAITQTAFTANWDAALSATAYYLDLSTSNTFSTFVSGYNNLSVGNVLTLDITGLTAGTTYFYRLRSSNTAGITNSENSNITSQITVPPDPVAIAATSIAQTSFVANWNVATGATNYYLEVSINSDLSAPLAGYDGTLPISLLTASVTGLSPGIIYYYGVNAENVGGKSATSNVISQITIPAEPVADAVVNTEITTTSFIAKWQSVIGATGYELEVSSNDFVNALAGYNPFTLSGTQLQVTGLLPQTSYKFRVRAKNSGGMSSNSNEVSVTTSADLTTAPLSLANIAFSGKQDNTTTQTLNISVSGGTPPFAVSFKHKGILATAFTTVPLTAVSAGNYSFEITPSMLDAMGVEWEVTVTDATSATDKKLGKISLSFNESTSPALPFERFGGTDESWNLFSIPYELDNKSISTVFADYDPARHEFDWRLMRYRTNSHDYVNFTTGQVQVGEAYWFNAKENLAVKVGAGQTTSQVPFSMVLTQGWNLIGNPYTISISWNKVLADNAGVTGVGALQVFSGTTQSAGDVIAIFTGGFVFADASATLSIDPITAKSGGRVSATKGQIASRDVDAAEWLLPFNLSANGSESELGGIGMHPEANELKDLYDVMTIPRFFKYTDLSTTRNDYFYPWFARDVVPTQTNHRWSYTLSSNQSMAASQLTWNQKALQGKRADLYLLDKITGNLINMKTRGSYPVNLARGDFKFEVYYSSNGEPFLPQDLILGNAYPNPASNVTTIPVVLPAEAGAIELTVYDMAGKAITTLAKGNFAPGAYEFKWDLSGRKANGMFIYRLTFTDNAHAPLQKKLIIN